MNGSPRTLLFDFDGVFNALHGGIPVVNDGLGQFVSKDVTIEHRGRERTFPILYRPKMVVWFNSLVLRGHDVRWLTTWREHTYDFPETFGFLAAPWVDWQDDYKPLNWGKYNAVVDNGYKDAVWIDDHHIHFDGLTNLHCQASNILKITPDDRVGLQSHDIEEIEEFIND